MNPTQPSHTSPTALYISNWKDLVGIWKGSKLTQLDTNIAGPRLAELHYLRGSLGRRRVNQIVDYTGSFRDESNNTKYTQAERFESEAWFENDRTTLARSQRTISRFCQRLEQPRGCAFLEASSRRPISFFFVIRYSLANPTTDSITYNLLDLLHLHNGLKQNVNASFDASNNTMIADMTTSASYSSFWVHSSYGRPSSLKWRHDLSSPTVSGWLF
jgi:hypothetical protein